LEYSSVSKLISALNWLSPFVICSFLRSSQFVWVSVAFHQLSLTKSTFTDEFGLCTPFYTNGWGDLCTRDLTSGVICYPANQRSVLKVWVGVSSFQLSRSVYLRRCRTCRVGSLFNRWTLKYVHNLKYLSIYHSKIFKLWLCEPYFTS
jgi:hypothetical protein